MFDTTLMGFNELNYQSGQKHPYDSSYNFIPPIFMVENHIRKYPFGNPTEPRKKWPDDLLPGKLSHNYEKSPFFIGKSTISMVIFNSFLYVYQRVPTHRGFTIATIAVFRKKRSRRSATWQA